MEKQDKTYQDANAAVIDRGIAEGWEWGKPVDHQTFVQAKNGQWSVVLTPTKPVPHEWFGDLKGKKLEKQDCGWQFSHTVSEQIGSQLRAGFTLTDLYEDTNGEGRLHELHIPSFIATRAVK